MKIEVKPDKYIAAVSGGVDSMVLLDLLVKQKNLELVVAHFDHGIRKNSFEDAKFIEEAASRYGMPFEVGNGKLGPNTSEASARAARYAFLYAVQKKYKASAIITAHHQDDLIETALLNLLRGSGWRGLVAIGRNPKVLRPMLGITKKQILNYAKANSIKWREDPTNLHDDYLRNRLRQEIMPKLSSSQRQKLTAIVEQVARSGPALEKELSELPLGQADKLNRQAFAKLPAALSDELMLIWLRNNRIADIDRLTISRLSNAVKSAKSGSRHNVKGGVWLRLDASSAYLEPAKKSD